MASVGAPTAACYGVRPLLAPRAGNDAAQPDPVDSQPDAAIAPARRWPLLVSARAAGDPTRTRRFLVTAERPRPTVAFHPRAVAEPQPRGRPAARVPASAADWRRHADHGDRAVAALAPRLDHGPAARGTRCGQHAF